MKLRVLAFSGVALAASVAACGGNVVVDHSNGSGGAGAGSGGTPSTGTLSTSSQGTVTPVGPGPGPGVGGFGGTSSVGPGGAPNTVSVGPGPTTSSGGISCESHNCSEGSDGSCDCGGKCSNGAHVHVVCFPNPNGPGDVCKCKEESQFIGSCNSPGGGSCSLESTCCLPFFF